MALSSRLWFPVPFRGLALASWDILSCWGMGAALQRADCSFEQTPTGFPRSARRRCDRFRWSLYRDREGVPKSSYGEPDCLAGTACSVPAPVAIVSAGSPNFHIPMELLTRPHQDFTCVHHIGLTLVCGFCGEKLLGFALSLSTPPLPATHREVGTGIGH